MITIPENMCDATKILFEQLALLKQESERNPQKLPELTAAMCEIYKTLWR